MTGVERRPFPLRPAACLLPLFVALVLLLPPGGSAEAMMESHFLYFPDPHLHMTPGNVDLSYEDAVFPAADGTMLHGWYIPGEETAATVLFFHGNAGNIAHRVDNLVQLNRVGLSVFIFDYRGYGRSQGKASERGLYDDGRGALAWLKNRGADQSDIIYFGRSLGAAVAVQMALEAPPKALILESPFTSVAAMGKRHFPILYRLLGWLIAARYDNGEKMPRLKTPLLLIHGTADSIVPASMGKELFALAPEPKQLYLIEGADHNDGHYLHTSHYWQTWRQFLLRASPRRNDGT